jgi:hypothetical protein
MKGNILSPWFVFLTTLFLLWLVMTACNLTESISKVFLPPDGSLKNTVSVLGTETSQLATRVSEQAQIDDSQQDAISYQTTQLSSISGSVTETPTLSYLLDDPTPFPVCTPPACASHEIYHCPVECPGGCGTTCATVTPGITSGYGHVLGKICFSEGVIPTMVLNFQEVNTQRILSFSISEGQDAYGLDIPAGVYIAFTTLLDDQIGGGYTHFVGCDRDTSTCTDHSLVPFVLQENHVKIGVDICDWHSDAILFPVSPEK